MQTIKNDDLEEIRELGSGTYGAVYHGKWRGCDVAIKRIKASCFAGRPSERERLVCLICFVDRSLNFRFCAFKCLHWPYIIGSSKSLTVFSENIWRY
jgi:hypothetical protein